MKLTADNKNAVILAIDDDAVILELIEAILLEAGFKNIITTVKAEDSVALYIEHNPDVILLDQNMPIMSGLDVINDLGEKCNAEYLPIIVVTADDDIETKIKVLQHGAKDYLSKPFDHFEMLARVNNIAEMSTFYKELLLRNKTLNHVVNEKTDSLMNAVQKQEAAEKELQDTLLHDGVTGLPNRYLFEDRLSQLIMTSKRNKTSVAVIVIGFDNYNEISNTIGHAAYDSLLRTISNRLKSILRTSDTVSVIQDATSGTALSRIGEDMFAIIVPIFQTLNDIDKILGRCAETLLEPIDMPDVLFDIMVRAGVSYFPEHGSEPEDLIQNANIALYHAREEVKDYTIYDITFDKLTKYRLNLMAELKDAIANDLVELYYQPKIDLSHNAVTGCEALIRWAHPTYGFIAPDSFIPMAEKTGTIRLLTIWVIEKALQQWFVWNNKGIHLNISINLSTRDLSDNTLVQNVEEKLKKYQVNPNNIIFEVTESSTMRDPTVSMNTLNRLAALGVMLSVDDYGTGYSSLSYLKSLPVNEIKIDKSFVMNMHEDKDNNIIVKSTIELAHNLGYSVVAEGIENKEIYDLLQFYQCDIAQGFFMSRPLPPEELESWLIEKEWVFT